MAVARRWWRAAFIVIGDIKGVKYIYSVYRVLKYYSNVEYTQHRPHEKIDFFVRSVLFFATARIFFATARKN
jgi:hypothetical protein